MLVAIANVRLKRPQIARPGPATERDSTRAAARSGSPHRRNDNLSVASATHLQRATDDHRARSRVNDTEIDQQFTSWCASRCLADAFARRAAFLGPTSPRPSFSAARPPRSDEQGEFMSIFARFIDRIRDHARIRAQCNSLGCHENISRSHCLSICILFSLGIVSHASADTLPQLGPVGFFLTTLDAITAQGWQTNDHKTSPASGAIWRPRADQGERQPPLLL